MGIVAIMPLTGPVSYLGQQELAGLRVAVDEINASGGINGIQLQLIAEDTQGNPKTAVTIAQKYAATKGISLFVVTTSKAVKAVAPICEEAKIPLAAICSDPDITSLSPIIFRPYMSFESEAALLGDFARSKKWKEVAFVRGDDEVFANELKSFQKATGGSTVSVTSDESFAFGTRDFRTIFAKIAEKKPDAIVALGWGFEVPPLLEHYRQTTQLTNTPVVGGYAFLTEPALKGSQQLSDGVYVVAFEAAFANERIQKLRQTIREKTGVEPNQFIDFACTYDVPFLLKHAVTSVDKSVSIIDALRAVKSFQGVAGTYSLDQARDARLPLALGQYQDGKLVKVFPQ